MTECGQKWYSEIMPIKQFFSQYSLSTRILFAVVSLIILFGTIAAVAVYFISKHTLLSINEKDQLYFTQDKARDIKVIIDEISQVSRQLSEEKLLGDALVASASPLLTQQAIDVLNHYRIKDLYSAIYIVGINGITFFSTDSRFVGQNYSFRPYFNEALRGKSHIDVGLGVTTNELGYYFSQPIYKDKKLMGIVVIKVAPSKIEGIIGLDLLRANSEALVTDDKGVILFSSKSNRLYMSLGPLSETVKKNEQKARYPGKIFESLDYNEVQEAVLRSSSFGIFAIDDNNNQKLEELSYAKVGNYPFYFVLKTESAPYSTVATQSAGIVSILVLIAATLAAIIIAIIVQISLRPMKELVRAADEIGKGNLSYPIPNFSSLEFSQLSQSFKVMIHSLQDLYNNLEKKVAERTKELDERNKRLNESESQLKNALETSERANKLMVGRELEMLELKKVIKTLRGSKI